MTYETIFPPLPPAEVREARREAGHTQAQAAEFVGVRLRTWQRYESDGMPAQVGALYRAMIDHPEMRERYLVS